MKADRREGTMYRRTQGNAPPDDPYYHAAKPPEPSQCPVCHAIFTAGRWQWGDAPDAVNEEMCPACRRMEDRFPAGYVTIKGAFFKDHRDEIIALIKAKEKREKAERPLQRIMDISDKRDALEVTTTDSHIARGIAEALHDAYKGDLKVRYSRDENLVRAVWTKN
jgi:NMD3 family protein